MKAKMDQKNKKLFAWWVEEILGDYTYIGIYGGRSSGKTRGVAQAILLMCMMFRGLRVVVTRKTYSSLEHSSRTIFIDLIYQWNVKEKFRIKKDKIITPGGGVIIFKGVKLHNIEDLKSLEGFHVLWIDEAAKTPQKCIDILRPTFRQDPVNGKPRSRMIATWNPDSPNDPIDMMFRRNPPKKSFSVKVNYTDNYWCPQISRDEAEECKRTSYNKFSHIWLGEYEDCSDALVFKNWSVEDFEVPPDAVHCFGADWGYAVDPTVLIRCHVIGRKLYIDYEAYMVRCEIVNIPHLFLTIPESTIWPIVADCSRPETISFLRNNGFPKIFGCIKGADSIKEGIHYLQSYVIIIHPRCENVIRELSNYRHKVDQITGIIMPSFEDNNNHCIDAIRYATESARRISSQKKQNIVMPKAFVGPLWQ